MQDIKEKKSQNRNPVKQWFITFSQVREVVSKEEFNKSLPPHDYSYTVEEEHEDEGYHYHMTIKLVKGISFSKLNKWFQEKFPNDYKRIHFKPVQNFDNCIRYCDKEDPKPVITGSLEKKKKQVSEGVARLLAEDAERKLTLEYMEKTEKEYMDICYREGGWERYILESRNSPEFRKMIIEHEEYLELKRIEEERKKWRQEGRDMAEFPYL